MLQFKKGFDNMHLTHLYLKFCAFIHQRMLSWFKMMIFMFIRIFLIFITLISFYENFITLIYQENNLLNLIIKFLFYAPFKTHLFT